MKPNISLGQYFTTNATLQTKVFSFIFNEPSIILEPCIGKGHLVSCVLSKIPNVQFDMFEIDNTIPILNTLTSRKNQIVYCDFITHNITKTYKTIIGNPPFIRHKKGNAYLDFVKKCFHLLEENGELVFIVPSDFFKLTSASNIIQTMMNQGTFTHIYHPHNETLFKNACIDVLIFRYEKNASLTSTVQYNDQQMRLQHSHGLITFSPTKNHEEKEAVSHVYDHFDVFVGLVSGREQIYKHTALGNIQVLNAENKKDSYIFIQKFPSENTEINEYLLQHKQELLKRKIKKFHEANWFEWGAPRNIRTMKQFFGQGCIYIHNLTRNSNVAFAGNVDYFGGGLIMLLPKKNNIHYLPNLVTYLNSEDFKQQFTFSGRFKISHRSICHATFPADIITCNK